MSDRIKVIWFCAVSNDLSKRYASKPPFLVRLGYKFFGKSQMLYGETGIWITNALQEFEKFDEVELHVVSPVRYLKKKRIDIQNNSIWYHFVRDEESSFFRMVIRQLFTKNSSRFITNRKRISAVVDEVKPDIVHCIGLENPYYSLALLDVSTNIPKIAQLAALLTSILDKPNIKNNPAKLKNFTYKSNIEKEIIRRVDYVGLNDISWARYITEHIRKDVEFLNLKLAMASPIVSSANIQKEYDFVYFSLNLNKAVDLALEAFADYHKHFPDSTLDVIGAYNSDLKKWIDKFIEDNNLSGFVTIEGRLETHDDLIRQIRKAKNALLPLKTDTLPTVIREAMSNGLPVVTTITDPNDGTPVLNRNRESVLLSQIGDVKGMSENMQKLANVDFSNRLVENAARTIYELGNNYDYMRCWVRDYSLCINNFRRAVELPDEILLKF